VIIMDSPAIEFHKKLNGKLSVESKVKINTRQDLSLAYTPGVAEPCIEINKNPSKVFEYTIKSNTVAVITDGTAVLGLGDIGPMASLPVMEGKAVLFKEFAGVNAFPIALDTKNVDEIVETVKRIAPVFGGVNLEDISAPRCFEVEERLQDLGIPVMHDDQHGTAVVVYAALTNALKVTKKDISQIKVVINGAGSAGVAVSKLLSCNGFDKNSCKGVKDIIMVDSKGIISKNRTDLDESKKKLAEFTNKSNVSGTLNHALKGADVFIGVSKGNLLNKEHIKLMNANPIIFALANPTPEIMPDVAMAAGASVVGTGRSDFPNQINNVLAFPGIFKGALEAKATKITPGMKLAAALALASSIKNPTKDAVLPSPLDKSVALIVAEAVKTQAIKEGVVRKQ
jgi:malate dehydrogenase (oxaloacetate-decarboxylating)